MPTKPCPVCRAPVDIDKYPIRCEECNWRPASAGGARPPEPPGLLDRLFGQVKWIRQVDWDDLALTKGTAVFLAIGSVLFVVALFLGEVFTSLLLSNEDAPDALFTTSRWFRFFGLITMGISLMVGSAKSELSPGPRRFGLFMAGLFVLLITGAGDTSDLLRQLF